ncbi:hypothetical protein [Streptomyces sp. NPDC004285]
MHAVDEPSGPSRMAEAVVKVPVIASWVPWVSGIADVGECAGQMPISHRDALRLLGMRRGGCDSAPITRAAAGVLRTSVAHGGAETVAPPPPTRS